MDTSMVGVLVYTHGHSSDGSSDLHSCTLHFGGPGLHHGYCNGGGLDNTTDTPMVGALVYPMDTPLLGVLVYTMDTPMVGNLICPCGHFNDRVPGLYPWKIQWWGPWFTLMNTSVVGALVYTIDTPMVGVLVYTHGYSNGGDPDLLPWTLQ